MLLIANELNDPLDHQVHSRNYKTFTTMKSSSEDSSESDNLDSESFAVTEPCTSSDSGVSSRPGSPGKVNRMESPPTPNLFVGGQFSYDKGKGCFDNGSKTFYGSNQDEFLKIMEPNPVYPPRYDSLPPGGCPKYPIAPVTTSEDLPPYSPSVYKVGVAARKVEWLSPYEPSPNRSWKHVIVELNSTQLNFYRIPSNLESQVLSFKTCTQGQEKTLNDFEQELSNIDSYVTQAEDLEFFKLCKRLNLVDSSACGLSSNFLATEDDNHRLIKSKNKSLIRSYSLQHAKIGLASDYKKRSNVLRIRAESEQILLNFFSTKELIDWNTAVDIGKDISLDLTEREFPKYRTVPRRRRRRTSPPGINRVRSHSDPIPETGRIRGKLSKLRSKFSLSNGTHNDARHHGGRLNVVRSHSVPGFIVDDNDDDGDDDVNSEMRGNSRNNDERSIHVEDRESTVSHTCPEGQENNNFEDDDDEHNLIDMNQTDDEDDEYDDEFVEREERARIRSRGNTFSSFTTDDEYKWPPLSTKTTQKKFYRNCLRCIKPLASDDAWLNKTLVKPTSYSYFNSQVLKSARYASLSDHITSLSSSSTSLSSIYSQHMSICVNNASIKTRSYSSKDLSGLNLPDTSLSRVPNHFVKEFIVGSHSLIPKGIF